MAPRGIVAGSIASVFTVILSDKGWHNPEIIEASIFFLIIFCTLFYGFIAKPLARLLRVLPKQKQGLLILGASEWSRDLAFTIDQHQIPVTIVDTNRSNIATAQKDGLRALQGDILSEEFVENLNVQEISHFLAMTPNDEINALAILHLKPLFSHTNMYQLFPSKGARDNLDFIKQGQILFGSFLTYADIENLFQQHRGKNPKYIHRRKKPPWPHGLQNNLLLYQLLIFVITKLCSFHRYHFIKIFLKDLYSLHFLYN